MNNMVQKSRENLKNRRGFTLIELIVVIVIIGILAAIIIPKLSAFTDRAEQKATLADAKTILTSAVALYSDDPTDASSIDDDAIKELTGDILGTIEELTASTAIVSDIGEVNFKYTRDSGYYAECKDSVLKVYDSDSNLVWGSEPETP